MIRLKSLKWRSLRATETETPGADGGGARGSNSGANASWGRCDINLAPKSWAGEDNPEPSAADGRIIGSKIIRISSQEKPSSGGGVLDDLYGRIFRNVSKRLQDEIDEDSVLMKRVKQLDQQRTREALQKKKAKKSSEANEDDDDAHLEKKKGSEVRRSSYLWLIGGDTVPHQGEVWHPRTQSPESGTANVPANRRRVTMDMVRSNTTAATQGGARPSLCRSLTASDLSSASRGRVRRDDPFLASATSESGASSPSLRCSGGSLARIADPTSAETEAYTEAGFHLWRSKILREVADKRDRSLDIGVAERLFDEAAAAASSASQERNAMKRRNDEPQEQEVDLQDLIDDGDQECQGDHYDDYNNESSVTFHLSSCSDIVDENNGLNASSCPWNSYRDTLISTSEASLSRKKNSISRNVALEEYCKLQEKEYQLCNGRRGTLSTRTTATITSGSPSQCKETKQNKNEQEEEQEKVIIHVELPPEIATDGSPRGSVRCAVGNSSDISVLGMQDPADGPATACSPSQQRRDSVGSMMASFECRHVPDRANDLELVEEFNDLDLDLRYDETASGTSSASSYLTARSRMPLIISQTGDVMRAKEYARQHSVGRGIGGSSSANSSVRDDNDSRAGRMVRWLSCRSLGSAHNPSSNLMAGRSLERGLSSRSLGSAHALSSSRTAGRSLEKGASREIGVGNGGSGGRAAVGIATRPSLAGAGGSDARLAMSFRTAAMDSESVNDSIRGYTSSSRADCCGR